MCDRTTLHRSGKEKAARVIQKRLADHRLRRIGDMSQIMANGTFMGDLSKGRFCCPCILPCGTPCLVLLAMSDSLNRLCYTGYGEKFEMGIFEDGATCEYIKAGSHTPVWS